MKNKMKNFFNLNIIIIIFIISLNTYLYSDEFYFEGQEIQIFDEGNRLVSKEGVKITTDNNLIIFANEFEYNKNKSELLLEGDIIVNDNDREIILKSEKLKYSKKTEKIITYGITNITIGNKYFIDSSDVNFFKKDGFLSSNQKTTITDKFENNFISQNFKFILENEVAFSPGWFPLFWAPTDIIVAISLGTVTLKSMPFKKLPPAFPTPKD